MAQKSFAKAIEKGDESKVAMLLEYEDPNVSYVSLLFLLIKP